MMKKGNILHSYIKKMLLMKFTEAFSPEDIIIIRELIGQDKFDAIMFILVTSFMDINLVANGDMQDLKDKFDEICLGVDEDILKKLFSLARKKMVSSESEPSSEILKEAINNPTSDFSLEDALKNMAEFKDGSSSDKDVDFDPIDNLLKNLSKDEEDLDEDLPED
jgi:hypothetical protein